jgi:ADP-dependent NAD(P)H-hydrate dehydratase / NAD(P)H-hydrate epimerase
MRYRRYGRSELAALLPPLPFDAHKYRRGVLGVIAGSERYPGAAVLCTAAALRVGAGYVKVHTTPTAASLIWQRFPSITVTRHLPEEDALPGSAAPNVSDADVWLVGPGLTVTAGTRMLVTSLLSDRSRPCVLDADALNVLASSDAALLCTLVRSDETLTSSTLVLTPHAGELRRLDEFCQRYASGYADILPVFESGQESYRALLENRHRQGIGADDDAHIRQALRVASCLACVVVAKGPLTVIATPDSLALSEEGTPALAKAGTGDVLAGIVASLLAQGLAAFDAAFLGTVVQGRAGQRAADEQGERGVCAEDVIDKIGPVMRDFTDGHEAEDAKLP